MTRIFGLRRLGPVVVSLVILAASTALFVKRAQGGGGLEATA